MKKFVSLMLLCLLLAGSVLPLSAGGDITVTVDGTTVIFDVPPQIVEGRTMVPLRKIFEALGATVNYNTSTRTVISEKDDTVVRLTIGDPKMLVNGTEKTLDVPGLIIGGRTLVPLRAVGEAFGAKVLWDGATRTAAITGSEPAKDPGLSDLMGFWLAEGSDALARSEIYVYWGRDNQIEMVLCDGTGDGSARYYRGTLTEQASPHGNFLLSRVTAYTLWQGKVDGVWKPDAMDMSIREFTGKSLQLGNMTYHKANLGGSLIEGFEHVVNVDGWNTFPRYPYTQLPTFSSLYLMTVSWKENKIAGPGYRYYLYEYVHTLTGTETPWRDRFYQYAWAAAARLDLQDRSPEGAEVYFDYAPDSNGTRVRLSYRADGDTEIIRVEYWALDA